MSLATPPDTSHNDAALRWQALLPDRFAVGESPFWHPHEQQLYWIDIAARQVLRCKASAGTLERWQLDTEPGCIAPAQSGGLVLALRDGIYRARSWGGALQPLARFNHDSAVMRFNDGKCDALGRLWAGTMYEPRDARRADLYCIDCRPDNGNGGKPQVSLKAHNAVVANGLAFSPAADAVYWADTQNHIVHAWDFDVRGNVLKRHRVFHQFAAKPAGWAWKTGARSAASGGYGGRPDGAAVDAQGCYWVAMMEGARLARFSPTGEERASVPLPVLRPTMPCFGGADLRTLYVTTIGQNADEHEAFPDSGRVLSTRVDVPGLPVNFFVD